MSPRHHRRHVCISQRFVPYPVSFSRPPGTLQCKPRFYNHTRYDGLNRRITSHIDSGAPSNPTGIDSYLHCYYISAWQILEIRQSDTPSAQPETLQPKHQYVWSQRYIDAAVLRDENTGANGLCDDQRLYYLNDANVTLDTGRELDTETWLYYYRNRYYGAELGRFLSRDPIGYHSSRLSLTEYAKNSPAGLLDPFGLVDLTIRDADPDIIFACIEACDIPSTLSFAELLRHECFRHCIGTEPTAADTGLPIVPGGGHAIPVHKQCCQESASRRRGDWGVTLCCKKQPLTCIYDRNIVNSARFGGRVNPRALQIVRLCVIAHETTHVQRHIVCVSDEPIRPKCPIAKPHMRPGYGGPEGNRLAECEAWQQELQCLQERIAMCGGDAACNRDVNIAITKASRSLLFGCPERFHPERPSRQEE